MSSKKRLSAERRTLNLKEQLLTEQLVVTDDFLQSVIHDVGVPLDRSDIDAIRKVRMAQKLYISICLMLN